MKKAIIGLIRLYQKHISPLKRHSSCKYIPTCSEYAILAVGKYGAFKGTAKALWRILRCNPFSRGGVDYP